MQAPGDETSKGGDCWRGKIRCVPSRDETDSCLVASDDRAMMRTHAAHASNARSKLRSKTSWGFRAERAQQSIDQSINQSIRPRSRFRAPAARFCKRHAMDATPMMPLPRLSHAAQHMETWATAARILSCTQGLSFPASVETRDWTGLRPANLDRIRYRYT
jgi:hypothetical protein